VAEDCLLPDFNGRQLWAQLGNLILPGERLFSPEQTLIATAWDSEHAPWQTPRIWKT